MDQGIATYIAYATAHGETSDTRQVISDLSDMLHVAWGLMTPEQQGCLPRGCRHPGHRRGGRGVRRRRSRLTAVAGAGGHLDRLNPGQRAAAVAPAPVLVLAGAGSGKTETLTRRVAHLILGGKDPGRLLCITFTNRAAGELRARLSRPLGPDRTPRWVGTFHAVMARLLIEDGRGIPGLPRGFAILGGRDARATLMQVAGIRDAKEGMLLQEAVSLLKNTLQDDPRRLRLSPALDRFDTDVLARAGAVLPVYRKALLDRPALDLDDLLAVPVAAMRADPVLAARWSARWAEVLVDEYGAGIAPGAARSSLA